MRVLKGLFKRNLQGFYKGGLRSYLHSPNYPKAPKRLHGLSGGGFEL